MLRNQNPEGRSVSMTSKRSVIHVLRTAALGDAVQMTPLLRQIRADMPDALIRCFTSANSAELFQDAPFVDEVISLPAKWLTRAAGSRGLVRAWLEVARHGAADVLISLEPTLRRNLGAWLCPAKQKAGIVFEGVPPLHPFTHPLRCPGDPKRAVTHTSELYLQLWTNLTSFTDRGFGCDMRHLLSRAMNTALPTKPYVCLAPGAGNAWVDLRIKRWPARSFIALGQLLMEQGFHVIYVGSARDLGEIPPPSGACDLLGKTSLTQAAHVLASAEAMLGNDSGLFHLASSVGCPAVGMFGPTDEKLTGPFRADNARVLRRDLPCAPCYSADCAPPPEVAALGFERPCCLDAITVQEAARAVMSLIKSDDAISHKASHAVAMSAS